MSMESLEMWAQAWTCPWPVVASMMGVLDGTVVLAQGLQGG